MEHSPTTWRARTSPAVNGTARRSSTSTAQVSPSRSTTGSWSLHLEFGAMIRSKGFTLVELSVAFIIIVLLLAGAMIPLSTQIELRGVADTQRSMDQIREAIIGFAQANGRLPCPADGSLASGAANAGMEVPSRCPLQATRAPTTSGSCPGLRLACRRPTVGAGVSPTGYPRSSPTQLGLERLRRALHSSDRT